MEGLNSEVMRELVDKLNSMGCGRYVELPQIAVMGDTSSSQDSGYITQEKLNSTTEIKSAIERITQQLVDEGQNISNDCIVINVRGPGVPNLTLIDLPGIVRTVGNGEDESMIPRIRALVDRYMSQKLTIILAVIPANVDIHNNEIVQAAQKVDPDGNRTIGIITKPDLVDKGAEESVIHLLNNEIRTLKLGYHMVVCRGQKA